MINPPVDKNGYINKKHLFMKSCDKEPRDIIYERILGEEKEVEIYHMTMEFIDMLDGSNPISYCWEIIKENMNKE